MNENQQNFDELKRLLKLKQHEVPPPGYFNNFSGNVVSRIRAGESVGKQTLIERLQSEKSWLGGFLQIFETRPGVIGGFAAGLCLLLVLGVVIAEFSDHSRTPYTIAEPSRQADNSMAALSVPDAPSLMAAAESGGITASTNPVTSLQPSGAFFSQPGSGGVFQNASFGTGR
jgi:hypothetical protein